MKNYNKVLDAHAFDKISSPDMLWINRGITQEEKINLNRNLKTKRSFKECVVNLSRSIVKILNNFGKYINLFMYSFTYHIIAIFANGFSLFATDIKLISTDNRTEKFFIIMFETIFILLFLEFFLLTVIRKRYIFSFFFYLDFLANLSMIPETEFIIGPIRNALGSNPDNLTLGESSAYNLANITNASQIAAKASKYIKIIRFLGFLKIIRLAKLIYSAKEIKKHKDKSTSNESNSNQSRSSHISKLLGFGNVPDKINNRSKSVLKNRYHNITNETRMNDSRMLISVVEKQTEQINSKKKVKINDKIKRPNKYSIGNNNNSKISSFINQVKSENLDGEIEGIKNDSKNEIRAHNSNESYRNPINEGVNTVSKNEQSNGNLIVEESIIIIKRCRFKPILGNQKMDKLKKVVIQNEERQLESIPRIKELNNEKFSLMQLYPSNPRRKNLSSIQLKHKNELHFSKEKETNKRRSSLYFTSNKSPLNKKFISKATYLKKQNTLPLFSKTIQEETKISDIKNLNIKKNDNRRSLGTQKEIKQILQEKNAGLEQILFDRMIKRLVLLIITLLIFVPIFDMDFINPFIYQPIENPTIQNYCMKLLHISATKALENPIYLSSFTKAFNLCKNFSEDSQIETNPYFYQFNFTNYETFTNLTKKYSENEHFVKILPNITYSHQDYEKQKVYMRPGFNYFRMTFYPEILINSTIQCVYNNNTQIFIESILNIIQNLLIAILLLLGAYVLSKDINCLIVKPLDKATMRLNILLRNTDKLEDEVDFDNLDNSDIKFAYKNALIMLDTEGGLKNIQNTNKNTKRFEVETTSLDNNIKVLLNLISISIGKSILNLIPLKNNTEPLLINSKKQGVRFKATYLIIKIDNIEEFTLKYKEKALSIINKIYICFHELGLMYLADIFKGKDLLLWKEDKEKLQNSIIKYIHSLNKNYTEDELSNPNKIINDSTIYTQKTIASLSLLCANKIILSLFSSLNDTLIILLINKVQINFILGYSNVIHGYVGEQHKIDEIYIGQGIKEGENIMKYIQEQDYPISFPNLYIHPEFLNILPSNLKHIFYPSDIIFSVKKNIFMKLYKQFIDYEYLEIYCVNTDNKNHNIQYKDLDRKKYINQQLKKIFKKVIKFKNHVEDFVLEDDDFRNIAFNNLPSFIINNLKLLFDKYKNNEYQSALIILKNIKEDFHETEFNDVSTMININDIEITIKKIINNL